MRAERFGSYSIDDTLPGTPTLSRLKSSMRSFRFAPPPRCRTVILPWLLRPALLLRGKTRDFSGLLLVISSKVAPVIPRLPGEVGRDIFKATFLYSLLNF